MHCAFLRSRFRCHRKTDDHRELWSGSLRCAIHQSIYLDAASGPSIHTPNQVSLEGWGPEVVGWSIAPAELESTIHGVIAWSRTEETAAIQDRLTPESEAHGAHRRVPSHRQPTQQFPT